MKKSFRKILKALLFYAIIIAAWAVLQYLFTEVLKWANPDIFVSPLFVARMFNKLIFLNANSFWSQAGATMFRLFAGYLMSVAVGILLAALMIYVRYFRENIRAFLSGIQSLPNICWVPFAVILGGLNEKAVYFVIIMGSAPSVALAIEASIRNVNPIYVKAGRTLGCNKIGMYTRVYIPAAMPNIILGLKQGWAFSWRALMAGEMNCLFSAKSLGLGYLMYNLRFSGELDKMLCIMIILVIIGVLFEKVIFGTIENKILRKHGIKHD